MSQADSAMYAAKRAGKNKVRVFDSMLESLELQQA
jgi:PleD family two-component response regulator